MAWVMQLLRKATIMETVSAAEFQFIALAIKWG